MARARDHIPYKYQNRYYTMLVHTRCQKDRRYPGLNGGGRRRSIGPAPWGRRAERPARGACTMWKHTPRMSMHTCNNRHAQMHTCNNRHEHPHVKGPSWHHAAREKSIRAIPRSEKSSALYLSVPAVWPGLHLEIWAGDGRGMPASACARFESHVSPDSAFGHFMLRVGPTVARIRQ